MFLQKLTNSAENRVYLTLYPVKGIRSIRFFLSWHSPENKGWQVIALLSDDTGIPKSAEDRLKVFDKIMAKRKCMEFHRIVSILIHWLRCSVHLDELR